MSISKSSIKLKSLYQGAQKTLGVQIWTSFDIMHIQFQTALTTNGGYLNQVFMADGRIGPTSNFQLQKRL